VASVTSADVLGRVEQALEIRDLGRAARPGFVSLRIGDGFGTGDTVRVGLADRRVDVDLDLTDVRGSESIRSRVDELSRALRDRGLSLGALQVSTPDSSSGWAQGIRSPSDGVAEMMNTMLSQSSQDRGRNPNGDTRSYDDRTPQDESGSSRSHANSDKEGRNAHKH
jgi:hypothetical protein